MKKLTRDMLELGIGANLAGSAIKAANDAELGETGKIIAGGYAMQTAKKLKLL